MATIKYPKKISKSKELKQIANAVGKFEKFLKNKKWIRSSKDFESVFGKDLKYRLYFLYAGFDSDSSYLEPLLEEAGSDYLSKKFEAWMTQNVERLQKQRAVKLYSDCTTVLTENLFSEIEKCLKKKEFANQGKTTEQERNQRLKEIDQRPTTEIVDDQVPGTSKSSKQPKTPLATPLRSRTRKTRPTSYRECSESDSELQGDEIDVQPTRKSTRQKRPTSLLDNMQSDFDEIALTSPSKRARPSTRTTVSMGGEVPNQPEPASDSRGINLFPDTLTDYDTDDVDDLDYGGSRHKVRKHRTIKKKNTEPAIRKIPKTGQQRNKEYRDRQFEESETDDDRDEVQPPVMKKLIYLGEFDNVCSYCEAVHFPGAHTCCSKGKVFFPPNLAMPEELAHYIFDDFVGRSVFKSRILAYNCAFAMASMSYHQADVAQHGVQIVKPVGNVGHYTSCAIPANPKSLAFGNFYVYQGATALDMRKQAYTTLNSQIMQDIQNVMDEHNKLGRFYRTMGEIIETEKNKGNDISYVRMKIVDAKRVEDRADLNAHPGIYASPVVTADHIALFYNATYEQQVKLPGLNIYGKRRPKLVPQPILSYDCRIPALCYPLLFPFGEIHYRRKQIPLYLDKKQRWSYRDRLVDYALQNGTDATRWEIKPSLFNIMAQVNYYRANTWKPSVSDPNLENEDAPVEQDEDQDDMDFMHQHLDGKIIDNEDEEEIDFVEMGGEYYPITSRRQPNIPQAGELNDDDNMSDLDDDLMDALSEDRLPIGDEDMVIPEDEAEFLNSIKDDLFPDITLNADGENEAGEGDEQGEDGNGEEPEEKKNRQFPSFRDYILYLYQQRKLYRSRYSAAGRLGQLFLTDQCARLFEQRNSYKIKYHTEFMSSTRQRILDTVQKTANDLGRTVGCITTMPPNEPGSPRYQQKLFEHTIAMYNKISKSDLFITATCNVNWPEIQALLKPGETWADHPFEVNECFEKRFHKLLDLILGEQKEHLPHGVRKKGIFGRVKWYSFSIEFQQRGPPHAHLIVSLKNKIKDVTQVEKVCQAVLPTDNPELRQLVEDFQIHRPCENDPEAYCRVGCKSHWKRCRKGFPKEFNETTQLGDRSYPNLRRPDNGETCDKHGFTADNRHVVPYNVSLLTAWGGHLNIEVISALKVVKYIFKYLFKGYDRALVEALTGTDHLDAAQMTIEGHLMFPKNVNIHPGAKKQRQILAKKMLREKGIDLVDKNGQKTLVLNEYWICQDMRALTPNEAAWEMQGYPRHGSSHIVIDLFVHEEKEEPVCFKRGEEEEVARRLAEKGVKTRFNAWMKLNREEPKARQYTYADIPHFYKFSNGKWVEKKNEHRKLFGRIRSVHPRNKELFAIRLLSGHQKGVQSYEELRTVDGTLHETFVSAAKAMGLMNDQQEWKRALREAASEKMPNVLRRLFVSILVFNPVSSPIDLWETFKEDFFENKLSWTDQEKEAYALAHIQSGLNAHGRTLAEFHLPEVNFANMPADAEPCDDSGNASFPQSYSQRKVLELYQTLNEGQKKIFDTITEDIDGRAEFAGNAYFLQGSGGTGKTRTLTTMYHHFNARSHKILCVAHTGVAAMLLPFGSTAHRAFHIPMNVEETMRAKVHMETREAKELEAVTIVFWDEATMTDRRIFVCVDLLMRALHPDGKHLLFGGVPFIFGGDWKQTLPIVDGIRGIGVVQYTLLGTDLKDAITTLTLTENMRAKDDPELAEFCAKIGDGSAVLHGWENEAPEDQLVELPEQCLVSSEAVLIEKLFGGLDTPENKREVFSKSAILTVDNQTTFDINNKILKLLTTEEHEFLSVDEHHTKATIESLDPEVYHTQTPSGMPPHKLKLKVGAVVILLRNINVYLGLVNGTRLIIEKIGNDVVYGSPINPGPKTPKLVAIHRLMFSPPEKPSREQCFIRTQFPLRLAFCITCNRAQGQTLEKAGLLLRTPCFAHGQLYVALSRVRSFKDLFIYNRSNSTAFWTNNVVYPNVVNQLRKETTVEVPTEEEASQVQTTLHQFFPLDKTRTRP